jgi:serpin B
MNSTRRHQKLNILLLAMLLISTFCLGAPVYAQDPGYLCGDVDEDGIVSIVDALKVAQHYVGKEIPGTFNIPAADVNSDGNVTIVDALMISQYYVGEIDQLNCIPLPATGFISSDEPYNTDPDVTSDDKAALVAGNSTFAFNLYQKLGDDAANQGKNMFYSPYSISEALAMAYAGADGNTATEMENTLQFTALGQEVHPAFNRLDLDLAERGGEEGFRLNIANSSWGQAGYEFLSPYLDTLATNYAAGMHRIDFASAPDSSRKTINQWVYDKTEEKIQDLLPEGSITDQTLLVLVNAIYFNAAWDNQFDTAQDGLFYPLDGSEVNTPIMHQSETLSYVEGAGYKALELPYDADGLECGEMDMATGVMGQCDDEMSMVILLPDADNFEAFENSLDYATVNTILTNLDNSGVQQVDVAMPKFNIEGASVDLTGALRAMGMADAFSLESADFSNISEGPLFIGGVIHKAYISVDEEGTEAAAATGVVMPGSSAPTAEFIANHPFVFFIRDNDTGTILFIGRVMNPAQGS